MLDLEARRLQAIKSLLQRIAAQLNADISVELWNGEVLPLGANARDDIRLSIRSPQAVRRLMLRPSLMTIFELFAHDDLDVKGGSLYDAAQRWDHMQSLRVIRSLGRPFLLKTLWPFLSLKAAPRDNAIAYAGSGTNSRRYDRDFIDFHYSISNSFYKIFLEKEMVYSAAYFVEENKSLEEAQHEKLDRICKKLMLKTGDNFLDIGCGWGGLICHAAQHYGVAAHGVTLSQAQFDFCKEKIQRLGLGDRIRLELCDYRHVTPPEGGYNKIAQIEMFEHLGLANHDQHFTAIRRLLEPRGLYLHQASVRRAPKDLSRFKRKSGYIRFIEKYIFPGGELDHIGLTVTNLERHNFEVHDVEAMREHFALTTAHWAQRLWERFPEAEKEVGRPRARMWLLYLTLVARSFERGAIAVFQTLASRRLAGPSKVPLARGDLFKAPR